MRLVPRKIFVVLVVPVVAAGCSTLPQTGPSHRNLEADATATLSGPSPVFNYALVDLNKNVLPFVVDPGPGSLYRTFGTGRGPAPELRVGIGDTIQVTLFEAQAGGLFIPSDAGSRPGNFVTLQNQEVDSRGFITVPYAGEIKALHRTTPEIQRDIIAKLKDRAIQPQAVVSIVQQTSFDVSVVGEVNKPNKFAINPSGDTVVDAIAIAGGIKNQGYDSYVTLQRHGLKGTVYFPNLATDPKENIYVAPGDALFVTFYQRSFLAFGATGASGQYKFQQDVLSLNDAVGKAGGLLDNRSDPGQVFVYRSEGRQALEKMGVDISRFPSDQSAIPTIYRVNFRDPSGFFASRKFPMRDGDVLYVDNADIIELQKVLSIITTASGPASSGMATTLQIRNWPSATTTLVP